VPRLYDPVRGAVRIGGDDVRDLTLESLRSVVGVVPQDAHLFHDTIRANLLYARPSATEKELIEACEAARIWQLVSSLPDGLDTIAGDRGYRFSGGEKQRLALARLLLKAPSVVVLDEATAHLDSESELAIQRALATALAGRTSLVIAAGGMYAGLYWTQFASQAALPVPRGPLQERVEIREQAALRAGTDNLGDDLAVPEDGERWHREYPVPLRGYLVLVHVHLRDDQLVAEFRRYLLQHGREHVAGRAPLRPEIDQDRLAGRG
jgi:ABC transporter